MSLLLSNKYYKSISYKVKDIDTLEAIRSQFSYIPHWKVIAEANNLEYPYIVSADYTTDGYSTGYVKFTRKITSSGLMTIPAGTIVSYLSRHYKTLTSTSIIVTATETSPIQVEALEPNANYNLTEDLIDTITDVTLAANLNVTNSAVITGGFHYKVVRRGETLYIPAQDYFTYTIQPSTDYAREFGIDIKVYDNLQKDKFGLFTTSGNNELVLAAGTENLAQAITRRLITKKGSLMHHPEYGSELWNYIGLSLDYNLPELLKIETSRTILSDSRVQSVDDVNVNLQGSAVFITSKVTAKSGDPLVLSLSLDDIYSG